MKEKFVRTTDHKSVEEIANANGNSHISKNSKVFLEQMKMLVETLRVSSSADDSNISANEIQMVSADNEPDITINNAHEIYGPKVK